MFAARAITDEGSVLLFLFVSCLFVFAVLLFGRLNTGAAWIRSADDCYNSIRPEDISQSVYTRETNTVLRVAMWSPATDDAFRYIVCLIFDLYDG